MRILILAGDGAMTQIRMGYAHAAVHVGHQCLVWSPTSKRPIFDVFAEFKPELILLGGWEIDRPMAKCLMASPETKIILWGGNWGEKDSEIDYNTYPILRISEQEKLVLPKIIENNRVGHVFVHYTQSSANITHDKWKELGLSPIGIPPAADLTIYGPAAPTEEYRCDVSFVGGYWPYKAINFDKWLLPLCDPDKHLKVKIFGYGGWPVSQHLGIIDGGALPTLFSSSCVNVNVFEPHVEKYGFDGNERTHKILACGGFCVSESGEEEIFSGNEVVFAKTPKDFEESIRHYLAHPEERIPFIERGISSVRYNNNYFCRLQHVFKVIGIQDTNLDRVVKGLRGA